MRQTGMILQPTYRVDRGRPIVQLYGRLMTQTAVQGGAGGDFGPAFLVEDDRFRPYCFVLRDAESRLGRERGLRIEPCGLFDLRGREVLRVETTLPGDVARLRERLGSDVTFEADIRFPYRYLIDLGIKSGIAIEGDADEQPNGLLHFRNPTLAPAAVEPTLRFLSLDLETTPDASEILSFALVGDGVSEVHLVSATHDLEGQALRALLTLPGVHAHRDEAGLLRALVKRFVALDPDVLLGWNVVDFDLRVLAARGAALGIAMDLGRAPGAIAFQEDRGFTRQTRASIPGRMAIDGIALVRDALKLPDYRLETVAQAVLGRGKLLDHDAPDAALEIQRLHREDPAALCAYNREDAKLVLEILEHEGLLDLCIERSLLSGMQLDRVGASIASFDLLYLPELRRRGFVAPNVDSSRASAGVSGGALLEPAPGFHHNVAVFDFKSLYPSLIRTFDLDPLAHALASGAIDAGRGSEDVLEAPNGARFARSGGILPGVVERFWAARAAARERGDPHAAQAIKIMQNALFGVLGATACRFFDADIANAITRFGQQTLHWTRDAFAEQGVRVLYGDTDSVFVEVASRDEAESLRQRAETRIAQRIEREYRVPSRLELEFECFYDGFFMPRLRGGRGASHKRYAGWDAGRAAPGPLGHQAGRAAPGPLGHRDGRLVVVGLESVRRDWPAIAARLQQGMLERAFTGQPVAPFVRGVVEQVLAGACDDELVYAKRVRKASLDRYTATTPPHVQAARKLAVQGIRVGPVVRYVVTATGPEPVVSGRALPAAIDRRHYVDRVLAPIADAILIERGESFDAALGRAKPQQLSLL